MLEVVRYKAALCFVSHYRQNKPSLSLQNKTHDLTVAK
jgi:hypothetical protein